MGAKSKNGTLARTILEEYYRSFQERNPSLRVFSAHLHMDETTPHIHIDFVPFTTGSKRGLGTRVSLKQALAELGFKGGTRGDTEWNQWVQSEKEQLAAVMERHGIEWEYKGTHDKHLSVLDYKKQEREKEVAALDEQMAEKKGEMKSLSDRVQNFEQRINSVQKISELLENDPEYQLPEPQGLMSAKVYKTKFVEPLFRKLKDLIKKVISRYYEAWDNYYRLNTDNGNLYRDNERLTKTNDRLREENDTLRVENKDYKLLRKVFGSRQIDDLVEQAQSRTAVPFDKSNGTEKRVRNNHDER